MDQRIVDEVADTLMSGWITTGPKTKRFEKEISVYCNAPATLCLNSATAGLEIMLRWFGVGEGDEVILPAYTYSATANVVMHCGATPVFVDVKEDFNIDPAEVEKHISHKTKVIMPVDFAGFPCNYDALNAIVKSEKVQTLFNPSSENQKKLNRILILSDAAHSFGAMQHGKHTGVLTDVSVFSFHAVKNLTTAEGGAIVLNLPEPFDNSAIYDFLCIFTLHGQNKDALAKMQKGNWRYDIIMPGYKCNMTDIMASIGLVELSRYTETLKKRKLIAETYNAAFSIYEWAEVPHFEDDISAGCYHLYPLRIRNISEQQRDSIMQKMFDKDIAVNMHFIPVPMLSFYKNMGFDINNYPVALNSYEREISLPLFYNLTAEQQQYVIDSMIISVEDILEKK
jgi:dTDP-4-amino-4,6-dideoxygalactose transaminase